MLQGYYRPMLGRMVAVIDSINYPDVCDTAVVNLLDSVYPYNILFSDTSTLTTNGFGNFNFANAPVGRNYIVQLKHRNTLEAHIYPPFFIGNTTSFFDLTMLPKQFCGDADTTYGIALLLSGDVNRNGYISIDDVAIVDNANLNMISGYVIEDLTGDGIVDQDDVTICDNNNLSGSHSCLPIGIKKNPNLLEVINIYPVPAKDRINVNTAFENYLVEVRNYLGDLIFTRKSFSYNLEITISEFNAGIYFISVFAKEKKIDRKFIKE